MTKQLLKVAKQVLGQRLFILPLVIFAIFEQDHGCKSWSTSLLFYWWRDVMTCVMKRLLL